MGYYVDVEGWIKFNDIEGFINDFPYHQNRDSEVGMHDDYSYFFTRMWSDDLKELKSKQNDEKVWVCREGKNWYNLKSAMDFLSKYADCELNFQGEEPDDRYDYEISDGEVTRYDYKFERYIK